jgi:hypothetical protein
LAIGAALGGLAVYLYDPDLGVERRGRLSSFWRDNQASALEAGRAASQTLESARPIARRVTRAVGRGDWAQLLERPRSAVSLPRLVGAAEVVQPLPARAGQRVVQGVESARSRVG